MDDIDPVKAKYPGNSWFNRFQRWFVRRFLAAEWIAKVSTRNLKSHVSVQNEQKRHLKHYRCVIHPCSEFKHYWDCIMIIVCTVELIIAPLETGLGGHPHLYPWVYTNAFQSLRLVFDSLCGVDVVFRFFIGYYNEAQKEFELQKPEIAKHYLKTDFTLDLLASLPIQYCWWFDPNPHHVKSVCMETCRGLALLKVLRLYILSVYVKKISDVYNISFYKRQLVFLSLLYCLIWHFLSCVIFYTIAMVSERRILFRKKLGDHSPLFLYVFVVYRGALRASISAGYGADQDRIAGTLTYVIVILQYIYSKIFQIFILAGAIELIRAKQSASRTYVGIANQVKEFMRHKQLPMKVQDRIMEYYEYHYHKEFFREAAILRTISGQLRRDILMEKCMLFTQKVEFFQGLPMNMLERIVSLLQLQTFMINDVIIKANTVGNNMYFISSGTVAVYTPRGKEICHLIDGEYFGEVALIQENPMRIATVISVETTEVFILSRKDFIRTINPYPDLLEKVQRVAAERIDYTTHVQSKFDQER